jgi:hypothetical protein
MKPVQARAVEEDATDYLLKSSANAGRLEEAVMELQKERGVKLNILDLVREAALD